MKVVCLLIYLYIFILMPFEFLKRVCERSSSCTVISVTFNQKLADVVVVVVFNPFCL